MRIIAVAAAAAILAALAFLHPAPRPALTAGSPPAAGGIPKRARASAKPAEVLVVYVAGEVRNSGLYRMPAGSRAGDAVEKAGGFAPHADRAGVNLAELLEDGQEIRVPKTGERAPRPRASARQKKRSKKPRAAAAISLNDAGVGELARVPGLGRTLAERIVAYRALNGPFASLDELADVSGMTQRRIDALVQYLAVR